MKKDYKEEYYFDPDFQPEDDFREELREQSDKEIGKKHFISGVVAGMTAALLILGCVYLGIHVVKKEKMRNDPAYALAEALEFSGDSAISPQLVNKLQVMEDTIDQYFYHSEIEDGQMQEGIYRGLMEALGDPYSEYYSAAELEEILNHTAGIYYGIGAYVMMDERLSLPKIAGVIAGAPAEAAQLRANDIICEVDGISVYGMPLEEAVAMMKGDAGTEVVLTIYREGESDYLKIPVLRAAVESPTVSFKMLDDRTAYIQIMEFGTSTIDQFAEALATARGSGMEGLILDLRTNPGGTVDAVVEICRMMLPEGVIVYTEDKNGERVELTCDGSREFKEPLVVLVDMNSASAAEIMAGAIQDYGIGTLVGTDTYGKGSVQKLLPFTDGSAVKITIARYFTPKGRDINEVGITPDVVCEFDAEAYYDKENPVDNQLEKAREVLNNMLRE